MHIAELIRAGQTDLWWHQSNLGLPLFAAYQPLPALGMGAVVATLGEVFRPVSLFKLSIIVCWAVMPIAWYRGSRTHGQSVGFALLLGLLTLTVNDPYSIGMGIRSATERGLYTQHFGLLFFPLFVGAFRQYIDGETRSALHPAALYALTAMSHLWVGLYAALAAGAVLLASPERLIPRLRRVVPMGLLTGLLLAWWLVPLLLTNDYAGGLPWRREIHNGWPWQTTVTRFFAGDIFDQGRPLVLTVLVIMGGLGMLRHRAQPAVRHWLWLTAITLFLFLGRTNLGDAYDWIPLHGQVNVMRYMTGLHVCGIVAAAACLHAVFLRLYGWRSRATRGLVLGLAVVLSVHSALDVRSTLKTFDAEAPAFTELVAHLEGRADHRFAVHKSLGTTSHFHRDLLPALAGRGQLQSYAHGYHCTLSTYYAEYFDFSPAACRLFDVDSIVARHPVPADFPQEAYGSVWTNDAYAVFHVEAGPDMGIFSFADVRGAIVGPDLRSIREAVRVLTVPAFAAGVLPRVGASAALNAVMVTGADGVDRPWSLDASVDLLASLTAGAVASHGARVIESERGLASYTAQVRVPDGPDAWLILKANVFPWWHAYVDDEEVAIQHVAPNFMAVPVGAGAHTVHFAYQNPLYQKLGALLSLCVLVFWFGAGVRRWSGH